MSNYSHKDLKAFAEERGAWIDVQKRGEKRGKGTGNSNRKERVSRALSWYEASESAISKEEKLIYSYIAFNALYVQEQERKEFQKKVQISEKKKRKKFLEKLQSSEEKRWLWEFAEENEKEIIKILSFPYLSDTFWDYTGSDRNELHKLLEQEAESAKRDTLRQIKNKNITPLKRAMERISLLRNQLFHGMAAYKDSYNRYQVTTMCTQFLHALTGCCIKIVIADKRKDCWGEVPYPPVGSPDDPKPSPPKAHKLPPG